MAGACLQGVEQDLCMGPLMTPQEHGSLTWPELSQDLSHSADDPPQGGDLGDFRDIVHFLIFSGCMLSMLGCAFFTHYGGDAYWFLEGINSCPVSSICGNSVHYCKSWIGHTLKEKTRAHLLHGAAG